MFNSDIELSLSSEVIPRSKDVVVSTPSALSERKLLNAKRILNLLKSKMNFDSSSTDGSCSEAFLECEEDIGISMASEVVPRNRANDMMIRLAKTPNQVLTPENVCQLFDTDDELSSSAFSSEIEPFMPVNLSIDVSKLSQSSSPSEPSSPVAFNSESQMDSSSSVERKAQLAQVAAFAMASYSTITQSDSLQI